MEGDAHDTICGLKRILSQKPEPIKRDCGQEDCEAACFYCISMMENEAEDIIDEALDAIRYYEFYVRPIF